MSVATLDETHDATLPCWVESANDPATDFPIQNLPFGRFRGAAGEPWRIGVAIGDQVLDLEAAGLADTQDRFEKTMNAVLRLMIAEGESSFLLPIGTARGLCRRWYDSVLRPASRVMGDLLQALPALRINDFFCGHALALDDTTLRLMLKTLDHDDTVPLDLPAEIFTLPPVCRQLAKSTNKSEGHLSEVVVQVTSTGTWAWLSFLAPVLPSAVAAPTQ